MARRAPTLSDVARRAGVHPATVSRALSRPDMVAPTTRDAIMQAVDATGYVANSSARRLAGGRAEAIGVVVPDITNPYFGSILQAIQGAAAARDLAVLIADSGADPNHENQVLATLSRRVDGLVVCTPVTDTSAAHVPVVQVNRSARGVTSVVVDQGAIVHLAVDHLVGLGHRHLAFLRGPLRYWSTIRRDLAVREAQTALRGRVHIENIHPVPGTFAGGQDVFTTVRVTGATGVIAFNDVQAAGLCQAAQSAGVGVPDELSVVGSDGLALTTMTAPTITTVAAPLHELGVTALERLLDAADGARRTVLQPHLVPRASSTGPPTPARLTNHLGRTHAHTG